MADFLSLLTGLQGSEGPSSDMKAFREVFAAAKNIVVLSGAGMSAESGVPTFRYEAVVVPCTEVIQRLLFKTLEELVATGGRTRLNSWPLLSHSDKILHLSGSSTAIVERSCIPRYALCMDAGWIAHTQ